MMRHDYASDMVSRLTVALEERLTSVVLYGPAAHADDHPTVVGEHLLIVVAELDLETMQRLGEPVRWWLKKGEPWPRLFSEPLLRASADVYPIELLEITHHRRILFGADPLSGVSIDHAHLRVQCERELREKLMRLREGYVESHGHGGRALYDLLAVSYGSFVRIFRACLYLVGAPPTHRDHEVMTALAKWLDLPSTAFDDVERVARGDRKQDAEAVFAAYYRALLAAEARIDRLIIHPEGRTP